ncbi:MAG: cytochrome c3 family protein, partial [Bacteroidia bacterium]
MSSFYSESTFLALIILSVVLLAIAALLFGIKRHLSELNREKFAEEAEPSFYEAKIKPVIDTWNPTIATLVIAGVLIVILGGFGYKFGMDEVGVQQGYAPSQPINFSHKIHAGQYEIDCKYCHSTVEKSKSASIPSLNTCMNCHKYVKASEKYNGKTSPEIQKIYNAIG